MIVCCKRIRKKICMRLQHLLPLLSLSATTLFAAIETWTNTEGNTMEAELIACHGANASFRKANGSLYSYPINKLSASDQERIREQTASSESTTTTAASQPAALSEQTAAAKPGTLTKDIEDVLVTLKGSRFAALPGGSLDKVRYYAIYYSAHWCPPCRKFTPELVSAYNELKPKHPEFELIFVSSDKDEEAMRDYMKGEKMPWPAARYDRGQTNRALKSYSERGIPNLVFVSADGEVLSASYVGGKYAGPRKVLKDIRAKLN